MIKVLFLAGGNKPDYMCDIVYHGLMTNEKIQLEEFNTPRYMFSTYKNKQSLYGKGFTMYGHLEHGSKNLTRWSLRTRVKRHYYDFIVFGSIHRFNKFFSFISEYYTKDKILVIDGEDHNRIETRFLNQSTYFKRELTVESQDVEPINFAIPQQLIVSGVSFKSKKLAHIIPGDRSTYIFNSEEEYYRDYQSSVFGITQKKAGWDCLRHYEILMNGCIPYFIDIDQCPSITMTSFPKDLIKETNLHFEQSHDFDHSTIIEELLIYTRNNLTTSKLVERILKIT